MCSYFTALYTNTSNTVTASTSYFPGLGLGCATFSAVSKIDDRPRSEYFWGMNSSQSSYCADLIQRDYESWISSNGPFIAYTVPWKSTTFGESYFSQVPLRTTVYCSGRNSRLLDMYYYNPTTRAPPCCGRCTAIADSINLYYWPKNGSPSTVQSYVDTVGFTL